MLGDASVYVVDANGTLHAFGEPGDATPPPVVGPPYGEQQFGYDWVESWVPMAGAAGAPYLLGPLVVGGLLALANRVGGDADDRGEGAGADGGSSGPDGTGRDASE